MKIVFFDVKSYDKKFIEPLVSKINALPRFANEKPEITFLSSKLNSETVNLAADADIVSLFVHDKLDKDMLPNMKCRLVACRSAGFDYVDLKECAARGIKVVNVPSYSPNSIAEFTVGLAINLGRHLSMAFDRAKRGDFKLTSKLLGFEMKDKVVGVFGTGKIGKIVCEIFLGFKMKVIAFDVYEDKEWAAKVGVEYVKTKDEVYARSQLISLHAPLTKENYHMIDENAIEKMRDGVLIINTGRGALIDTKALIKGIKSNKIGGVAMDVYENEVNVFDKDWYSSETGVCKDDDFNQLLTYSNVLVTSHQAYFTNESLEQISKTTIDSIIEFLEKSGENNNFSMKFEVK